MFLGCLFSKLFEQFHSFAHRSYKGENREIFKKIFLSKTTSPRALIFGMQHHLMVLYKRLKFDETSHECSLGDPLSSFKFIQMVPVHFTQGPQRGKQGNFRANFKNLLWNHKTQSFDIWYVASPNGPLWRLFKLCPLGQNGPDLRVINITQNYIGKPLNDISS